MADQDAGKGNRRTRSTAETAAAIARRDARQVEEQLSAMAEAISRTAQVTVQRDRENLELMTRLAETMAAGFHAAASEATDWSRQAADRHAEAMRRLTQARSLEEVLAIQDGYVHDNLQALLEFGAKLSQLSGDNASEASRLVQKKKRR